MRSKQDDVAYITGEVLTWARKRSGLGLDDVADKSNVGAAQVKAWENGSAYPPFKTAQNLAKLLKVPFGFLFLPVAPEEDIPLPDFRTVARGYKPTPDFLELLNSILVKQDWYREHVTDAGEARIKFIGRFTISVRSFGGSQGHSARLRN